MNKQKGLLQFTIFHVLADVLLQLHYQYSQLLVLTLVSCLQLFYQRTLADLKVLLIEI